MCTLFVLEDDLVQQYILKHNLARFRVFGDIAYYQNGAPLVDYLHANKTSPERIPDMLFLDLEMPGVNGWNVLDELKTLNQSLHKKIIVYVITASISITDKLRALSYSFVREFISKPVTRQHFNEISHQAQEMLCHQLQL